MHECTESEPVRRLFAHVDFECCCCTGAGDDEHGDFAADDRSRIVLVVDEYDLKWSKMATSTKKHVDPPLASDTFEHVDDVDGCENYCRSAAHGTADRPE